MAPVRFTSKVWRMHLNTSKEMLSTHFHYVIVIRTLLNTSSEHSHYHHPMGHILLLLLPGVPRYHHLENILWHLQKYLRLFSVLSLCSDRDCKSPLPCSQNKKKKGPSKRLPFFASKQKFSPINFNVNQRSYESLVNWNGSFMNEPSKRVTSSVILPKRRGLEFIWIQELEKI